MLKVITNILKNKRRGFTLIELLVVIAIIGFLVTVAFAFLNSARVKARDARRISDLEVIGKALTLFYDQYGYYPVARDQTGCGGWGVRSSSAITGCGGEQWLTVDANFSKFLSKVPVDPINKGWYAEDRDYTYTYTGGTNDYDLRALLENSDSPYRCELHCYETHIFVATGRAWCKNHPASSPCGGVAWWDNASQPMLYSDH